MNIGAAGSKRPATCLKFSDIFHHETEARRRTMSHLAPLLTFESFVPSPANRRGYLAALLVSERAVANVNLYLSTVSTIRRLSKPTINLHGSSFDKGQLRRPALQYCESMLSCTRPQ